MTDPVARLRGLLSGARAVLVFTGAGISTGSKIPDYRGPAGIYRSRSPVYYEEFLADPIARREYWEMKRDAFASFRDAEPNAAHRALVDLERSGRMLLLVTQNIDGLHRAAGSAPERLLELHGTNAEAECIGCGRRETMAAALARFEATGAPPRCVACEELVKPAVVMFGQSLDAGALVRAFEAAERADLVLSLGSSLSVTPAADIPLAAARRRVPYVIINQGPTSHDALATLRLDAALEEVLPAALRMPAP